MHLVPYIDKQLLPLICESLPSFELAHPELGQIISQGSERDSPGAVQFRRAGHSARGPDAGRCRLALYAARRAIAGVDEEEPLQLQHANIDSGAF